MYYALKAFVCQGTKEFSCLPSWSGARIRIRGRGDSGSGLIRGKGTGKNFRPDNW